MDELSDLQYRCSAPSTTSGGQDAAAAKGTLCDYGPPDNPSLIPLAVTPDGSVSTKETLLRYPNIDPHQVNVTITQVQAAVVAAFFLAFVVNTISAVILMQVTAVEFLQLCLRSATTASSHLWTRLLLEVPRIVSSCMQRVRWYLGG